MRKHIESAALFFLLLVLLNACGRREKPVVMVVRNSLAVPRINESVVVPMGKLPSWIWKGSFVLLDSSGQELRCQLDDCTGDGIPDELYFQYSFAPEETATLRCVYRKGKLPDYPAQVSGGAGSLDKSGGLLLFTNEEMGLMAVGLDRIALTRPWPVRESPGASAIRDVLASGLDTSNWGLRVLQETELPMESGFRLIQSGPLRGLATVRSLLRSPDGVVVLQQRIELCAGQSYMRSRLDVKEWPEKAELALQVTAQLPDKGRWVKREGRLIGVDASTKTYQALIYPEHEAKEGKLNQNKAVLGMRRPDPSLEVWSFYALGDESPNRSRVDWERYIETMRGRLSSPIEVFVAQ